MVVGIARMQNDGDVAVSIDSRNNDGSRMNLAIFLLLETLRRRPLALSIVFLFSPPEARTQAHHPV